MIRVDLEVAGQVGCLKVGSSDRRIAGTGFGQPGPVQSSRVSHTVLRTPDRRIG